MRETLSQDLRYGFRMLGKNLGFTVTAVLALAIGIGANTAIFSMVNTILLRPLGYKNADQLVWIWARRVDRDKAFFSVADFIDHREQNQTLDHMIAIDPSWGVNLTDRGESERLQGVRISAEAFQVLGIDAAVGRTLVPDDGKPDSARVVLMSYGLWQRRFGSNRNWIGNTLTLNDNSYTLVGVLPPDFIIPNAETDLVTPIVLETDPRRADRDNNFLRVLARLKPGVTAPQAQSDLDTVTSHLREQYPTSNAKKVGPKVLPLQEELVGNYQQALLLILGAVALVLFITCSNLANLMLVRASARRKEIAIRAAMGASRLRLIQQLLTEGAILAFVGGTLGLLLAVWGVKFLLLLSPANLPRAAEVSIDIRVLAFTLALSILSAVIFALVPALQASKADLNETLKAGGKGSPATSLGKRTRHLLVIAEVALSLVLLIAAGLLVKSFQRLQQVDPGFDTNNLLVARLSLPQSTYKDRESMKVFYEKIADRVKVLPGVKAVGLASVLPLSGMNARSDFSIAGRPVASLKDLPGAQNRWITPGYFALMNIPVLQGREFTEYDTAHSQGVAVIDEALARRYWPNENPIGARLRFDDGEPVQRELEVVGVVGNVKYFGLDEEPLATLYAPFYQIPESMVPVWASRINLVTRTANDPMVLATSVRNEVQAIDKNVPASNIRTMGQFLSAAVAQRRFNVLLLTIFAAAALLLTTSGIYAVISFSVIQRTNEIGLRMALGAQRSDVLKVVMGHGLKLVLIGVVVGLAAAFAFTRVLSSLLFGVSAGDPMTFILMPLLLIGVALLASFNPARKATKIDPVIALRSE
jgi:predicted permease